MNMFRYGVSLGGSVVLLYTYRMAARIERVINSQAGLNLAASLARAAPPWLGYALAGLVARWISSRRHSEPVKAVRSNQWVVGGEQLSEPALDVAVQGVFQSAARSIYELYHYIQDSETPERFFSIHPSFKSLMGRPEFDQTGLVVAGLHISNFDLALQWICSMNWIKPLVLTIPNPQDGRQLEFEIRKKTGMNLVPASMHGIRQAIHHLKMGGTVATGIDRPVYDSPHRPLFFGRPASLPIHYIHLALAAHVPVILVACRLEKDGLYHLLASAPIEMDSYPGRKDELVQNAEKVLSTAEDYIRLTPDQWVITQAVWPDVVNLVPV
jgi:KDO2-lipid IV(A) lauroyltransferase